MKLQHWAMICVSIVVVPMFAILCWQLWILDAGRACEIVSENGVPPGRDCFDLMMKHLDIRGVVIIASLAGLISFVLVLLVYLAKTVISVVGPGNVQLKIGNGNESDPE